MGLKCRIDLLGGLRVQQGERVLTRFQTQKTAALLAFLACFPQRPHPREELIARFWPESDLDRGRLSLSVALSSLRHQLEPPESPAGTTLLANRASIRLNPENITTDVADFELALRSADQTGAVALYRGELLPGYYDEWCLAERTRLAEAYLQALRTLTRERAKAREFAKALDYARRAVQADPLREELHRDLMRLYVAVGQPSAALRQYGELERVLKEALGTVPTGATRQLAREITAGEQGREGEGEPLLPVTPSLLLPRSPAAPSEEPPAPAPPVTESETTDTLPHLATRFFGREEELARLTSSLSSEVEEREKGRQGEGETEPQSPPLPFSPSPRLVTLTGPGGTGKTRLAVETARRMTDTFSGRVWFVPLADLTDAGQIMEAAVEALHLPHLPDAEPLEQLVEFLNGLSIERSVLSIEPASSILNTQYSILVLDNFEHLVEEGATLVQTLLAHVPTLTCLVTSRQLLGVAGEQEFPVAPLPVPDQSRESDSLSTRDSRLSTLLSYPSVALFVDRAQAVQPAFQVTQQNAADVAALCSRLEGIPLALELAASRAQVLTPAQMLERLSNRFELLSGRRRDASPRHRTLRAAIDWSYQLLVPELQGFFARLSVFRGGWSLEAAEQMTGSREPGTDFPLDALDALAQLRECSLIRTEEETASASAMRFRMLESLREFAAEQLSAEEREALARLHADYFLRRAEEAEANLQGAEQARWLTLLEAEHDNLRASLAWTTAHDVEMAVQLCGALQRFWYVRGLLDEGRRWTETILARSHGMVSSLRVRALIGAGSLARDQGDFVRAAACCREGLEHARQLNDAPRIAFALHNLGLIAVDQCDYAAAAAYLEEALALHRAQENRAGMALALNVLGLAAHEQGNLAQAEAFCVEAAALSRALQHRWSIATAQNILGYVKCSQGDQAAAATCLEESLALSQEIGSLRGISLAQRGLGTVALHQGDLARARALLMEALPTSRRIGDRVEVACDLELMAQVHSAEGRPCEAARFWGAATALREAIHSRRSPLDQGVYKAERAALRDTLGDTTLAAAEEAGRALAWKQAVEEALTEG